jgi:4-amino-4-deoxy-L-arabinose transferase-like glycosyltransferase
MAQRKQMRKVEMRQSQDNLFYRHRNVILLLILVLGAGLRLVNLGRSPPGLNQDEAANAWNAYCLLKTGKDQVAVSWPVFYSRCLGGNSSTLYIYSLLAFQVIGGLNVITARLPAAIGGVLTIFLLYYAGRRLFGWKVGLLAAFLLSLNPWHIQQSRWGHEASLAPLLGIIPLAALLWANMPVSDDKAGAPRPILAALGGGLAGICCYGYHSVRLFVPIFLLAVVSATLFGWGRQLKERKGVQAIVCFIFFFAITFGPLAWQHIFHPEGISRHALQHDSEGLFIATGTLPVALENIVSRYIQHFGLDFLFIRGDPSPIQSTPGIGQYHWYMLPLMISGLVVLAKRIKTSYAARAALAFVVAYPVGDCFYIAPTIHALRSSPGLCSLILLAAVGGVCAAEWLWKYGRALAVVGIAAFAVAVVSLNARYLHHFYGKYNGRLEIYHTYNVDLVEACRWLRSRLDKADAVFCTTNGMNQSYIITLVALGYEPEKWFSEGREFKTIGEYDYYTRYGKIHFMYGDLFSPALEKLQADGGSGRIFFIVRPGELDLKTPVHQITRPDGQVTLWICQR